MIMYSLADSISTMSFMLERDVGVHGAGSVVRNIALSIMTPRQASACLLRKTIMMRRAVRESQDTRKKIIVQAAIIPIALAAKAKKPLRLKSR